MDTVSSVRMRSKGLTNQVLDPTEIHSVTLGSFRLDLADFSQYLNKAVDEHNENLVSKDISSSDFQGTLEHEIASRLFLVTHASDEPSGPRPRLIEVRLDQIIGNLPSQSVGLEHIFVFLESIDAKLGQAADHASVATVCTHEHEAIFSAMLLLGAYMIIRLGRGEDEVELNFRPILRRLEASSAPDARSAASRLRDSWAGLHRAHQLGWLTAAAAGFAAGPRDAGLSEFVPRKLILVDGPSSQWSSGASVDRLVALGVCAVVRLAAAAGAGPEPEGTALASRGVAVANLSRYPSAACPAPELAAKFLLVVATLPGAVAVGGPAGLAAGLAATLAGLHLMRGEGFSARQAAGWLRAVRPGCLAEEQERYLAGREAAMRRTAVAADSAGTRSAAGDGGARQPARAKRVETARRIAAAVGAVEDRLSALRDRNAPPAATLAAALPLASGRPALDAAAASPPTRLIRSKSEPRMLAAAAHLSTTAAVECLPPALRAHRLAPIQPTRPSLPAAPHPPALARAGSLSARPRPAAANRTLTFRDAVATGRCGADRLRPPVAALGGRGGLECRPAGMGGGGDPG